MASGVGLVLKHVKPTTGASYHQIVRRNALSIVGGTRTGRESSTRLFGFSASFVIFALGIERKKDKQFNWSEILSGRIRAYPLERTPSLYDSLREFNRFSLDLEAFRAEARCRKGGDSPISRHFPLSLNFLTPVFCAGPPPNPNLIKIPGRDEYCDCSLCFQERNGRAGCPPNQNGGHGAPAQGHPQYPAPKGAKPIANSSAKPMANNAPQGGHQYSQGGYQGNGGSSPGCGGHGEEQGQEASSKPKVSNKRCGHNSPCSRSSDPDADVEMLAKQLGGLKQMDWSMESDLSHCLLMRQATQVAVDAVTRIVTEAVSAYEDYHSEYQRVLEMLMEALEESRRACGPDKEVLECKIILIRAKVDEMKRKIMDVDMFLGSLERFCHSAAEAAFMSHAEYASMAMSERLQSMTFEIKRLRDETKDKERDMLELQSLIIVETGRGLK